MSTATASPYGAPADEGLWVETTLRECTSSNDHLQYHRECSVTRSGCSDSSSITLVCVLVGTHYRLESVGIYLPRASVDTFVVQNHGWKRHHRRPPSPMDHPELHRDSLHDLRYNRSLRCRNGTKRYTPYADRLPNIVLCVLCTAMALPWGGGRKGPGLGFGIL